MISFRSSLILTTSRFWTTYSHRLTFIPSHFGVRANNNKLDTMSSAKARTALDELATDGAFKRRESVWRNWVSTESGSKFQPEKDRYHLYVSYACPWAHRTLMTRAIKGLEDVVSITIVMPVWKKTKPDDPEDSHNGWVFADEDGEPFQNTIGLGGPFPSSYPDNAADPHFGAKSIREVYEQSGDTEGKYTVPILFDKKTKTIVSNESSEIIQMLNSQFNDMADSPEIDLEPEDLTTVMKEVDALIYPNINNGVYRCGFATSQKAYDKAIEDLTAAFDRLEEILSSRRFLAGDRFTLSDIRLFVTLVRFDEIYVVYFKTNTRSVANSPALLNYCREIYQMPGVAQTVNMDQIKLHYYCSHPDLNRWSIIAKGPDFIRLLTEPHNRDMVDGFNKRALSEVTDPTSDSSSRPSL